MRQLLVADGYEVREFSEKASIYVVNTCTVTNMADHKSRQMLHRAKRKNPDSMIVAVGCYAQEAKEKLQEDEMVDIVVGNNMKSQIVQVVEDYVKDLESRACKTDVKLCDTNVASCGTDVNFVKDMNKVSEYEALHITAAPEHTRAYIKIQDGCNQFCSYCIIPYARGRVRSRAMGDILEEVRKLAGGGCKEFVLTGIHISSYGLDFEHAVSEREDYGPFKNSALIDLLEALACIEGVERIRLGSLEPRIITETFVERLAKISQICPHFHLSLQSGCDATLKRMNRHYSTELYMEKVALLRRFFDRPAITTDVIVGFPSESEEEFACTEQFLAKVAFADMHIFKYSRRQGTKAATMPNQIASDVQNRRSESLLKLAERQHEAYIHECETQAQHVL